MTDAVEHPRASFASLPAEILVDIRKHVPNLVGYVHFSQICKASWDICDEVFWQTVCTAAGYGLPNVPIKCQGHITTDENDPRHELVVNSTPLNQLSPASTPEDQGRLGRQNRPPTKMPLTTETTGSYANLARCVVADATALSKRAAPELRYEEIVINQVVNDRQNDLAATIPQSTTYPEESGDEDPEDEWDREIPNFNFSPWPDPDFGFLLMYTTGPHHSQGATPFGHPYFICRFVTEQCIEQVQWDVGFPEHKESMRTFKNPTGVVWADMLPQAYADVKAYEAKRDARTLELQQRQRDGRAAGRAVAYADRRWLSREAHCRFTGIEYNDPKRRPIVRASWVYH